MSKAYSIFNNNGEILRVFKGSESNKILNVFSGEHCILGDSSDATRYIPDVNNPVITDKPTSTVISDKTTAVANGIDAIALSSVPIGATVSMTGPVSVSAVSTSATVSLVFDIAGTYIVKVGLFPYLPYEISIDAT